MKFTPRPLEEQVMVITGASSGIGLATAEAAARKRCRLVLAARSEQTLSEICRQINDRGSDAVYVAADVGQREQVQRIADEAIGKYGRIDTWVNNAGVSIYGRLEEVTEADVRRMFDTNFWGVVHGSLVALPYLRMYGGTLVNVGSEVSEAPLPLQGMYAASKHAVKGFNDSLRIELEDENAPVSVVLIQPTAVNTPFPQHARNYMSHEPKLPSPQIDPNQVAEAILDAAVHARRHIKVGTMSMLNTAVAKFAPALEDRIAVKQVDEQQRDEPPRHPEGTLYHAGEEGHIRGEQPPAP